MKILCETGWGQKLGGARRVAMSVLRAMTRVEPQNQYWVVTNTTQAALQNTAVEQVVRACPAWVPQVLWDQAVFPMWAIPAAVRRLKPDVALFTNNYLSPGLGVPSAVFIHDMTPFVLPGSFKAAHSAYQRAYFRYAAHKADRVLTISESSRNDILRILKVPEAKVVVVPLASDLRERIGVLALSADAKHKWGITAPFILYVGAIHPRKNVARLMQAFVELKTRRAIPHQLVIAGALRWMAEGLDVDPNIKNDIIFTGKISDEELAALYGACSVTVYPSLYEGFGLPVLEAMSFGAPVVTSTLSSLPEVAGDAAILVDPYSVTAIAEGIAAVIEDPATAARLRSAGLARAAEFSWDRTAQEVLNVLKAL